MEARNYYEILGAAENASEPELERLYKRLARQHHPDRGGDAEEMKAINEAYRVLGNEFTRRAYDSRRKRAVDTANVIVPSAPPLPMLIPNTVLGRFMVALFTLMGGLVFLFLISVVYLRFMWPIFLVAVLVVLFGVWKLHEAIVVTRKTLAHTNVLHRWVWARELAFWCLVGIGAYIIYLIITLM